MQNHKLLVVLAITAAVGACSKADTSATDSAAGAAATATPPADTGSMAGMNHDNMGRPAAKDGDQEFLRMMSDHHEGLIQMASAAMTKASSPTTQADAHRLHTKQLNEQKQMIEMDQARYQETLTPMAMGSNKAMSDALQAKTGAEYYRAFYSTMVAHHRDGIKMIDDMLPKLTSPELKQMAAAMKSDQQKEIAEFERKAK